MGTCKENQGMINSKTPEGKKKHWECKLRGVHAKPQESDHVLYLNLMRGEHECSLCYYSSLFFNCTQHILYTL